MASVVTGSRQAGQDRRQSTKHATITPNGPNANPSIPPNGDASRRDETDCPHSMQTKQMNAQRHKNSIALFCAEMRKAATI